MDTLKRSMQANPAARSTMLGEGRRIMAEGRRQGPPHLPHLLTKNTRAPAFWRGAADKLRVVPNSRPLTAIP